MARIFIKKTQEEWNNLSFIMSRQEFRSGLPNFIRRESFRFVQEVKDSPDKISTLENMKIQKEFIFPESQYEELFRLSVILRKPVSTIIDEFVISPLLLPK